MHNKIMIDKFLSFKSNKIRLTKIIYNLNKMKTIVIITKKCLTFRKSVV